MRQTISMELSGEAFFNFSHGLFTYQHHQHYGRVHSAHFFVWFDSLFLTLLHAVYDFSEMKQWKRSGIKLNAERRQRKKRTGWLWVLSITTFQPSKNMVFLSFFFVSLLLLYWLLLFVGLVSVTDSLIPVVNWFLFYFINISLLHKIYCIWKCTMMMSHHITSHIEGKQVKLLLNSFRNPNDVRPSHF